MNDVQELLDRYADWLRKATCQRDLEGCVDITTPYLDRRNDYLQFFVRRENGGYVLTDDGYVLDDLEMSGCKINSSKCQAFLRATLTGFGVHERERALKASATPENFALRTHNLVQAMQAASILFFLDSPNVTSCFHEDVATWLNQSRINYTSNVQFTGKSGLDHRFDFVIPKSSTMPERFQRVINPPSRETAQSMVFTWIDTQEARPIEARAYAVLNDMEQPVSRQVLDAMSKHDVRPIAWSARDEMREELAA